MPPIQPKSPNPDFDFMLKDNQQPARGKLALSLPKPAKIALLAAGAVIGLIIIFSVLSGHKSGSTQPIVSALARLQETLRITALVQPQLQDPQTQALAATVSAALTSDKQQLSSYLVSNHKKVSPASLAVDADRSTDAAMQAASQNNSLDAAYISYLKESLAKYQTDLQTASNSSGPKGKKLIATSSESIRTLLNSPPLKT